MPLLQLVVLAVAAMIGLAMLRVVRAHLGRTPLPEGRAKLLFILAFVFVPPITLSALTQPAGPPAPGQIGAVVWVPFYAIILAGLVMLMGIAAVVLRHVAPARSRPLLMLALVGSEGDPDDVPFDPPVTAELARIVSLVERANAVFPRGTEFPAQVERVGFRFAWDTLDTATASLEARIRDDIRLGLGAASAARATAKDARSRLDSLHSHALDRGLAWTT